MAKRLTNNTVAHPMLRARGGGREEPGNWDTLQVGEGRDYYRRALKPGGGLTPAAGFLTPGF